MKTATVTEAKNQLSALIDQVKAGEPVTITDRGTPVARMEPIASGGRQDGRLSRLVRAGIVKPAAHGDARAALANAGPAPRTDSRVVDALLDERRDGR